MLIDKVGHDGDGHCAWTLGKDVSHLLVLEANHILTIDLGEVMVDQHSIPAGEQTLRVTKVYFGCNRVPQEDTGQRSVKKPH